MTSNGGNRSNAPWYTWRVNFHGATLLADGRDENEAIREAIHIWKKYHGIEQTTKDVLSVEKRRLLVKGVDYVE